ncbi:Na(+)-translocating NADH-quinone reductase subunit A [Reichenbachiella carrageenanivorans]|uniref:Na(+)-translocating NADH-quinone reductase subunit A n=1 Tax=Reichenbachiella carrageenanivorans TaxID=2979869 RepID=A0ABY6D625_9BACT|nr:Na(+)-translocating NADH-quinone reductase subunit A [Reichenbachiella carrageenanivorans]UXX80518.1 Na(+)-translocating NADH-quinone reductase subunit A [Reichenbachiella carrageenanivorans]
MSQNIKLRKGFDINLAGKAEKKIGELPPAETYAIKPTDFIGMDRPKLLVKEGDQVKAGTPIMIDKLVENVMYSSPVSGEIAEVVRGAKRKILEIRILADKEISFESFDKHDDVKGVSKAAALEQMTKGGVWPNIIQRPFGVVANPDDSPKNIFVSAFDTHPLAPDMNYILEGEKKYFEAGISILAKLTEGKVHVNVNAADSSDFFKGSEAQTNTFSGPHPAGNVGVQIHHLAPINKGEVSWTVHPYGVVQIGKLFLEGKYDASKVIALAGSEVHAPQYYKTYTGVAINKLIDGTIKDGHVRYISGNVLTGSQINSTGYLGFYHNQLSVIPEGDYYELFGWILPTTNRLSFHRAFGLLSFLGGKKKEFVLDTNNRGQHRAFVQTGAFEKVTPMDILPTHLLKAVLAEDFDDMEGLGIYEVIEEDLALCEFIDVSKNDVQAILREGLDLVKNS